MSLSYRRPTEDDARLLLDWRLRPDISRHLFTQVEDDIGKQRAWLARSNARDDYHHRIMMVDGVPVGYASITITHAAWGIATLGAYMADRRGRTGSAPLNFTHRNSSGSGLPVATSTTFQTFQSDPASATL